MHSLQQFHSRDPEQSTDWVQPGQIAKVATELGRCGGSEVCIRNVQRYMYSSTCTPLAETKFEAWQPGATQATAGAGKWGFVY